MPYIVFEKNDLSYQNKFDLRQRLNLYLQNFTSVNPNNNTIISDIHNTLEFNDGDIDQELYTFIKTNFYKINIILLSYDGNNDRIRSNYNLLCNYSDIFKSIPIIFIKKRVKHFMICHIYKLLLSPKILFIDDNSHNIDDATKLLSKFPNLTIVHYTKHVEPKYNIGETNIKKILDNFY